MTGPKVAMGIPYYRSVEGPTLLSCMHLSAMSADAKIAMLPIGTSGCYIEDNRNGCIEYALNIERSTDIRFTHFLWIDGDMIFPGDALIRLLRDDKDIVGANYRLRTPPYKFSGVYADGTDNHLLEPGLHRMQQLPTGLMLTRFDIYRQMGYPWFKPGLHTEARDDIYFCRRAVEMGYEIWCDHDLTKEVQHISVQNIPWFQPDQLPNLAPKAAVDGLPVITEDNAQMNNEKSALAARDRAAQSAKVFEVANRSAA